MKYKFENVYVNRLDLDKLAAKYTEEIGEPVKIPCFGGLIMKPKAGVIDTEIVLRPVANDGTVEIPIYPADRPSKNGGTTVSVFPKWNAIIDIDELKEYVVESLPLSEYLKDRRGYNSRLDRNEAAVTKWLNKKEKPTT